MNLGTMEQRTEEMKKQAKGLIDQAYFEGMKEAEQIIDTNKAAWKHLGRNEAWEAARKLVLMSYSKCNEILSDGVLTIETNDEIFTRCTASEAIEKLRKYEEQKKQEEDNEIRVGDEVYLLDENYHSVVTCIYDLSGIKTAACITQNEKWVVNDIDKLHKTGRHFPEIAEVLKKMQEGTE